MKNKKAGFSKVLLLLCIILIGSLIVYFSFFYPPVDREYVSGSLEDVERAVRYRADITVEMEEDPIDRLFQSAEFQNLAKDPEFIKFLKSGDFADLFVYFWAVDFLRNYSIVAAAYNSFHDKLDAGALPSQEDIEFALQDIHNFIKSEDFQMFVLSQDFQEFQSKMLHGPVNVQSEEFQMIILSQEFQDFQSKMLLSPVLVESRELQRIVLSQDLQEFRSILQNDDFLRFLTDNNLFEYSNSDFERFFGIDVHGQFFGQDSDFKDYRFFLEQLWLSQSLIPMLISPELFDFWLSDDFSDLVSQFSL